MTNKPQAEPAVEYFQGLIAKLATANAGVKSVGAGLKSLVALLDLINSPSPEISDQIRLQLSASALRLSRRILTESHTAHKLMHAQLRAIDGLTVVGLPKDDPPAHHAVDGASMTVAEPCEVTRHD